MRFVRVRVPSVALAAVAVVAGCTTASRPPLPRPCKLPPVRRPRRWRRRATTATSEPPAARAELRVDHYAIEPANISVPAGTLTLAVANVDRVVHDVVLLRTDRAIDALLTTGIQVDEADPAIDVVARTARLDAGEHGDLSATLAPGRYVLVCTVPHHYVREAMVATLTVTG